MGQQLKQIILMILMLYPPANWIKTQTKLDHFSLVSSKRSQLYVCLLPVYYTVINRPQIKEKLVDVLPSLFAKFSFFLMSSQLS